MLLLLLLLLLPLSLLPLGAAVAVLAVRLLRVALLRELVVVTLLLPALLVRLLLPGSVALLELLLRIELAIGLWPDGGCRIRHLETEPRCLSKKLIITLIVSQLTGMFLC